jgi:hypothetical protein
MRLHVIEWARAFAQPVGAFVSDLDSLVADSGATLWVHGHTHYPVDYAIGRTRVFSNPRGYARNGQPENAAFDPHCVLSVED